MATNSESKTAAKSGKNKPLNQEMIVQGFQELRNQQRAIAGKISELEMERKEHELVISALKEVDGERKCFRMVGGVLVERTVKEVQPALVNNYDQLGKVLESLTKQLETRGKELNEYREKYNIRIRGEDEGAEPSSSGGGPEGGASKQQSGVLVAQNST